MSKVVIYHGNCYDGVTAAWVAFRALDPAFEGMTSDVHYYPLNYSDHPPDVQDKDVYIIDFSFKRPLMEEIAKRCRSLTVLDHHKTAEAELRGFSHGTTVFDMERSGAGIAWDHFFPDAPRPDLVSYVEDRDLWRFALPSSKVVNAYIQSFDITLDVWISRLAPTFTVPLAVAQGESLLRIEEKYVKQICANARLRRIGKHIGPYVETSILMSEVCDYLIREYPGEYPFSFYSFRRKDGKIQYGLRSRSDFDVSVIAREFGGGGHKQAAGFETDSEI